MRATKPAIFLLAVLLMGCASLTDQVRMNKYDEITRAYGEAIVWGHFDAASLFLKDDGGTAPPPDIQKLENIKVASYDVKNIKRSEDKSQITQIVEIKYYKRNQMIVTSIRDEQVWVYDSHQRSWLLKTGLPSFK
jgi:hypothetical protein